MKEIIKYKYLIVIIATLLFFGYYFYPKNKVIESDPLLVQNVEESTKIKVDIKGHVINPGVYELENGKRVSDLIEVAGGLKDGASTKLINLSKLLIDETVVIIYSNLEIEEYINSKEVVKIEYIYLEKECICIDKNDACIEEKDLANDKLEKKEETLENSTSSLVNINTANLDSLMTLTGIGESKAKAIIEYRTKETYKKIEDLKNVTGIGDSIYEKIKNQITI